MEKPTSKLLGLIVLLLALFGTTSQVGIATCNTQGADNASRPPSCVWHGDELIRR